MQASYCSGIFRLRKRERHPLDKILKVLDTIADLCLVVSEREFWGRGLIDFSHVPECRRNIALLIGGLEVGDCLFTPGFEKLEPIFESSCFLRQRYLSLDVFTFSNVLTKHFLDLFTVHPKCRHAAMIRLHLS